MKTRAVIDADNQRILERFDENEIDKKLEYYKSLGKWDCVDADQDGDIILWKE